MKIQHILDTINTDAFWINFNETRDIVLCGSADKDITKVGVCWVATNKVIDQAIEKKIPFIISHENPFYHMTTSPKRLAHISAERKKARLEEHGITVYRCHDLWDMIPEVGVADLWAKRLGFDFQRKTDSYIQHATIPETTVRQLATHVAKSLCEDGENGVYIFGNPEKKVTELGMGTGAATDIFKMLDLAPCDACIVADDGISNFYQAQYAIDNDLPLIVVNHSCCEIAGIKSMQKYIAKLFPELEVSYLEEGYTVTHLSV